MSVVNLPPTERGLVRQLPNIGQWMQSGGRLSDLADALAIPAQDLDAKSVKSIPDAWAQVETARRLFLSRENLGPESGRAQLVDDWRGLLALFALAEEYKLRYQLELTAVPLTRPDANAPPPRPRDLFLMVLGALPPRPMLAPELADWSQVGLLAVRDLGLGSRQPATVVGLLTPDLLVTPGKRASDTALPSVPWFRDGASDPTKTPGMKGRDYAILATYLAEVRRSLRAHADQSRRELDAPLEQALTRELLAFEDDCLARVGDKKHYLRPAQPLSTLAHFSTLHAPLLNSIAVDKGSIPPDASDCRLELRTDLRAALPEAFGVVLIAPEVAQGRGRKDIDVTAWRADQLSDALQPTVLKGLREDAKASGYMVLTGEDFFTPRLLEFEETTDSIVPGHDYDGGFTRALLPLSPLVLLIHGPSDLNRHVKVTAGVGGARIVTLTLPLTGGAQAVLRKAYEPSQIGHPDRPMDVAFWPNFSRPDWRWNYLQFQNATRSQDLQTRFGVSGLHLLRDIAGEPNLGSRIDRLRQWGDVQACSIDTALMHGFLTAEDKRDPNIHFQRIRFRNEAGGVGELHLNSSPFEAICFSQIAEVGQPARPVGMVLTANKAPPRNLPAVRPAVAIDFGTTNTVIKTDPAPTQNLDPDRTDQSPEPRPEDPLVFRSRVMFPITARGSEAADRDILKRQFINFMPLMTQATPLPTVMRDRELPGWTDTEIAKIRDDDRPLFPDSAFFISGIVVQTSSMQRLERRISKPLVDDKANLIFDLKWSSDPEVQRFAKHFRQQMLLMAAAEMAAAGYDPRKILWRFSYPEAMRRGDEDQRLQESYYNALKQLFPDREETYQGAGTLVRYSEGEAAAQYFSDLAQKQISVILDIGGGTTDVAVWVSREGMRTMIWHGSFKLAGGDFLTHFLVNNPEFLKALRLDEIDQVRSSFADEPSDLLRRAPFRRGSPRLKEMAELFFNDERFPQAFKDAYERERLTPLGSAMRGSALTAVGGLMFYIGRMMRQLVDAEAQPGQPKSAKHLYESEFDSVSIAFGGRGALFLSLLKGIDQLESKVIRGLTQIMLEAAEVRDPSIRPQILFSPQPKLEAVLGMISSSADFAGRGANQEGEIHILPLGETLKFTDGEEVHPWRGVDNALGKTLAEQPQLRVFDLFLELLAKHVGVDVDLNGKGAGREIADHVYERLQADLARARAQSKRPRDEQAQEVEPPFVVALRALVNIMGKAVVERDRKLTVTER